MIFPKTTRERFPAPFPHSKSERSPAPLANGIIARGLLLYEPIS